MTLLELAERCERTDAANYLRLIETMIHEAVFGSDYLENSHQTDGSRILPYCRSLDAALTLVPKGCGWQVNAWGTATVMRNVLALVPAFNGFSETNPALALCAAALRARAAMEVKDAS